MTEEMKLRLYIIIGEKIKKQREKSFFQAELAERVKLSRASISNIEKGRQHVTIDSLWNIANALSVDPHSLLPSVEEMQPAYDDIYLKQLDLSEKGKRWIKGVIEKGVNEDGKIDK